MLNTGVRVRTNGLSYCIAKSLGVGGEGEAYEVIDSDSGNHRLMKKFHDHHDPQVCMRRTRYLMDQQFERRCPLLTPPIALIEPKGARLWCGYLATYRQGQALDEFLYVPEVNLIENLQLAIALVHGIAVMHRAGLSHGDLHPKNVIVERRSDVSVPFWIDLDNFNSDGVEPSAAWGALEYLAPEVRMAMVANRPCPPSITADRFSLTCLLHDVLLVRHVAAGHDDSPEAFNQTMTCGRWLQDPAHGQIRHETLGGLSNLVLNAQLAELFRRGLGLDADERPTAEQWKSALLGAADQVFVCPNCGYPNLIDASKQRCPSCSQDYPVLTIKVPGRMQLLVDRAALVVGRRELQSPHVSQKHAALRRIGPETWIESLGQNGTFRWCEDGGWIRLPDGQCQLIELGDRLRFADVEAHVC